VPQVLRDRLQPLGLLVQVRGAGVAQLVGAHRSPQGPACRSVDLPLVLLSL
jgi:hypothetical protein